MYTRPQKILIIDDDVELATLLTDYLTLEGFEARSAQNGLDGLTMLAGDEFDLVVLDVMMPGMSGTETLTKIREKYKIPVLMLTARGDPVDRILGLELGADDYVPKPCTPRELVARMRAILRRTASGENSNGPVQVGKLAVDLSFMPYAPVIFISAKTGQRLDRLFETISFVHSQNSMRIPTGKLNEVLAESTARVQPPTDKGKRLRIYYMTQASTRPPAFVFFVNDAKLFHFSYQRYLENRIREVFGLSGTPVRFIIRERGEGKK